MKEWSDKFCSYNSYKGLLYSDNYKSIREWKDGKIKQPLPPVEISLDLFRGCNAKCSHCNASRYLLDDKTSRMPDEHLINLIKFFKEFGSKAICFGGGGESTLHTKIADALLLSKTLGLENSIATNGINFNENLIKISAQSCRWIGVSVDSANVGTYIRGRGVDGFNKTTDTIKKLSKEVANNKYNCLITYKFLIFSYNQYEIFDACKIAKDLGANEFHCRPADLGHQGMHDKYKNIKNPYNLKRIEEQFEKCFELEDDNFKVFCVVHKFDKNFMPKKNFENCVASPCCIQICPNGETYLCPDSRYNEFYKLGEHYPYPHNILKLWGSQKHYDLVFKTGKKNCQSRCTFNPYQEQCERLFINDNDPFCKNFI